jgi:plastocyanin
MPRLSIIAPACLVLTLALGACGDDKESQSGRDAGEDGTTVTTNPTPQAQTSTQSDAQKKNDIVSVDIKDIKFVPHDVTAKVGQKIVWTNSDDAAHNVTAEDGANFASDTMQKGDTFQYTPRKAGTIKYVCTIHTGQDGTITVTG